MIVRGKLTAAQVVVPGLAAVYHGGMQVRRDHAENDQVRREMITRSRSVRKYEMGMWARRSALPGRGRAEASVNAAKTI